MLRSPEFGNSWSLHLNTIIHRNLNGDLRVVQRPLSPVWEAFTVRIIGLNRAAVDEFTNFIIASTGNITTIIDFEGRAWRGIIVSPEVDIINRGRNDCDYEVGFSFEGAPS